MVAVAASVGPTVGLGSKIGTTVAVVEAVGVGETGTSVGLTVAVAEGVAVGGNKTAVGKGVAVIAVTGVAVGSDPKHPDNDITTNPATISTPPRSKRNLTPASNRRK